jgi:uncharacterized protein YgiM (DUF1202 family)
MRHVRVALVILILMGCAPKPPAPPSTIPGSAPAAPTGASAPAAAPAPSPTPAPQQPTPLPASPPPSAPPAPSGPPAPRPAPPPASPAPAPTPPRAPVPGPTAKIVYVKTHLANLREGGGTSMKILRVLRQGTRLEVLEERSEWFRVRLQDGQEGWVAASVTAPTAP